jgi:hypothetical protein
MRSAHIKRCPSAIQNPQIRALTTVTIRLNRVCSFIIRQTIQYPSAAHNPRTFRWLCPRSQAPWERERARERVLTHRPREREIIDLPFLLFSPKNSQTENTHLPVLGCFQNSRMKTEFDIKDFRNSSAPDLVFQYIFQVQCPCHSHFFLKRSLAFWRHSFTQFLNFAFWFFFSQNVERF